MRYLRATSQIARKTHESDLVYLRKFERYAGRRPWPAQPNVAAEFLSDLSRIVAPSSLFQAIAAIRRKHLDNGWKDPFEDPLLQASAAAAAQDAVRPEVTILRPQELAQALDRIPQTEMGLRDKAMILLRYCGRFSREALSRLDRADVNFQVDGMRLRAMFGRRERTVTIRSHAADSRYCAVAVLAQYMRLLRDDEPAVFRIVRNGKLCRKRIGYRGIEHALSSYRDENGNPALSARSLVASAIVTATNRGADEYAIMRQFNYATLTEVRRWRARYASPARNVTETLGL